MTRLRHIFTGFTFTASGRSAGQPARAGVSLVLLIVALAFPGSNGLFPAAASAQDGGWDVAVSEEFAVVMQPNDRLSAGSFLDAYGHFADTAIEELSLLLDMRGTSMPVAIYVFADMALYQSAVDATGRNELDDVVAVADPEHYGVIVPLTRFIALAPLEAENQLRHAFSHIFAGQATDGMIPRGFDEGFARYVERFNQPSLAALASIVQGAYQDGQLASWSNMNRAQPLDDDSLIEAQSYAVIGYLLKNHGLQPFRTFLEELKTAPSWRDAIKTAYSPGTSDTIERQWKDEIPLWAQGDWKWNLVSGFDLGPARDLLTRGNFDGAANALLVSEQLLSEVDDPDRLAEVTQLKDEARIGGLAEAKMAEAQQALENFAYDRAAAAVEQAEEQYRHLPIELRPTELIAEYQLLASAGLEATESLELARIRSGAWGDYPEARDAALSAGGNFAMLGDTENRQTSETLIDQMDQQQLRLVLLLGALAFLTAAWLGLWLWYREPSRLRWD